jgi:hypothetical protein
MTTLETCVSTVIYQNAVLVRKSKTHRAINQDF